MSNDIILSLKDQVALLGGVDEDTLAVAGGVSGGIVRLSLEGNMFRKKRGGKELAVNEERSMNIIFVKMAHTPNRVYYPGVYKKGVNTPALCWSTDSKVPDADVKTPQASSCDACPFSVKGSGQGGTGTACKLSWRTAVVLPQDPSGDVMQLTLSSISSFGKEDGGKWPFRPYVQMLANNNISAGKVVTKMQFDPKSSVSKVLFSPVAPVTAETYEIVKQQGKTSTAEQAVKLTVYKGEDAAPAATEETVEVAAPVVRETAKKVEAAPAGDMADVVKKWTKK